MRGRVIAMSCFLLKEEKYQEICNAKTPLIHTENGWEPPEFLQ
jgi:hypothetical protein